MIKKKILAATLLIFSQCIVLAAPAYAASSGIKVYRVPKSSTHATPANTDKEKRLQWGTPPTWREDQTPGIMQTTSFTLSQGTKQAKGSIVILGGQAGGLVSNVNRWRSQIGLPALSQENISKQILETTGNIGSIKWLEITGSTESILAAILKQPEETIFVKLKGERTLVHESQDDFLSLAKSIKYAR